MSAEEKASEKAFFKSWISTMKTSELKSILDEENSVERFVRGHFYISMAKGRFSSIDMKINDQRKLNIAMANENIEKKHVYEARKAEVMNLYEAGKTKFETIEKKRAELKSKLNGVLQSFQKTLEESHKDLEEIIQNLLQGKIDSNDFAEKFINLKTEYCLKEVKTDRLKILLQARVPNN